MSEATFAEHEGLPLQEANFAVSRALKGESIHHEQRVYLRAGAEPMDALISAQPMQSPGKEVAGALVIIRDVTELYSLHRRLEDTERYLAIGQMAADIAHDLNNVLSTISQAAEVVEQQKNGNESDRRFFLAMIHNAVRRGSEIIQRMREYIRGGKGERVPVNVTQILREALDLTRPLLAARGTIELRMQMPPNIPVMANAPDLRRSFCNIILNAVEAMPQGGVLKVGCSRKRARLWLPSRIPGWASPRRPAAASSLLITPPRPKAPASASVARAALCRPTAAKSALRASPVKEQNSWFICR